MSTLKVDTINTRTGSGNITFSRPTVLTAGDIVEADIADNAITLAKMAGGTDGQIITYDASGDPVAVGPGTDGQVLTSTGAGSPPAFEAATGFRVGAAASRTSAQTLTTNTQTKIQLTTELHDPNGDFDNSSDYDYTVAAGEGGIYAISGHVTMGAMSNAKLVIVSIYVNGSVIVNSANHTSAGGESFGCAISTNWSLSAADVVTLYVLQKEGGDKSTEANAQATGLSIQRIA